MKENVLLLFMTFAVMESIKGQTLDLTFTANNNAAYVKLDSIKMMNRSQGGETVIYWPDTTLTMTITPGDTLLLIGYSTGYAVGVRDITPNDNQFQVFQSHPNPVKDLSMISMYIPGDGKVNVMVNDIHGRAIISNDWQMVSGIHYFRFSPGGCSLYFLTARWNGVTHCIKIINVEPNNGKKCLLDYAGSGNNEHPLKAVLIKNNLVMQESGILDIPSANKTYNFQFATNIPCPGTPTVIYEGQVYNTIQIFSQCWLKENLNVGNMIIGTQDQTNNGIKEKYCYNNNPDSCTKYGGLYQWNEMMQYTTQQGVQGLCPPGWHLPTDEEWKVLAGAVDSQYGIGDQTWDGYSHQGYDAGTNLKTTSGWYGLNNGTDLYGFSSLPGGYRYLNGVFNVIGGAGNLWTSSKYDINAWMRELQYDMPYVYRINYGIWSGNSVRCLRNL